MQFFAVRKLRILKHRCPDVGEVFEYIEHRHVLGAVRISELLDRLAKDFVARRVRMSKT
jgi:hypothetical protein